MPIKSGVNTQLSVLFLAVFIDLLGFGIIIPIIPFLAIELGANSFTYGLLISVYSFMQFLMAPIWGKISDQLGRKIVILIGVGGSVIGFSLFGIAHTLNELFIARITQGIFTAATLTTANTYIADVIPPEKRGGAFGIITSAFGLGFALGPGIGGYLTKLVVFNLSGHIVPSLFAASLSFINFTAALILLPESYPKEKRELNNNKFKFTRKNIISLFPITEINELKEYPGSIFMVILFSIVTFGFSNQIAAFALYAPAMDPTVDEVRLGIYYTYAGLVLFFSQPLFVNPMIKIFNEVVVIRIGALLIFIGFVLVPMTTTYITMLYANAPLIFGLSMLNPSITSLLSKKVPQHKQGVAMGINQGMASLMRVVGPLIAGGLMVYNLRYPFYFASVIFFVFIILVILKLDINQRNYEESVSYSITK